MMNDENDDEKSQKTEKKAHYMIPESSVVSSNVLFCENKERKKEIYNDKTEKSSNPHI